jgi:hypothetical protein
MGQCGTVWGPQSSCNSVYIYIYIYIYIYASCRNIKLASVRVRNEFPGRLTNYWRTFPQVLNSCHVSKMFELGYDSFVPSIMLAISLPATSHSRHVDTWGEST